MARLVLNYEGVGLVTHELVGDTVMIGRAPSNHIVIDHLTVSAQHALLLRVRDSYWLKDLDATNRTQINDIPVTEAELNDGDRIRFGSVIAVYAGCSRKRSSTCAIKKFWTSSTTRPKSDASAEGIQDAIEES
jgi:pSer/pThr/pTyr-binding forkhead associated (FHA) protein